MAIANNEQDIERKAFKALFQECSKHGEGVCFKFYMDKESNLLVVDRINTPCSMGYANYPKSYMDDPVHGEIIIGSRSRYRLMDDTYTYVTSDAILLGKDPSKEGLTFRDHC